LQSVKEVLDPAVEVEASVPNLFFVASKLELPGHAVHELPSPYQLSRQVQSVFLVARTGVAVCAGMVPELGQGSHSAELGSLGKTFPKKFAIHKQSDLQVDPAFKVVEPVGHFVQTPPLP
jgi:hypothetical protein